MVDADEIARLRELAENGHYYLGKHVLSLIAALEQTRQDVDIWKGTANAVECLLVNTRTERDQAQKEAKYARALLVECLEVAWVIPHGTLRARIEAMLEQKP
jgi:hypothetical protein